MYGGNDIGDTEYIHTYILFSPHSLVNMHSNCLRLQFGSFFYLYTSIHNTVHTDPYTWIYSDTRHTFLPFICYNCYWKTFIGIYETITKMETVSNLNRMTFYLPIVSCLHPISNAYKIDRKTECLSPFPHFHSFQHTHTHKLSIAQHQIKNVFWFPFITFALTSPF